MINNKKDKTLWRTKFLKKYDVIYWTVTCQFTFINIYVYEFYLKNCFHLKQIMHVLMTEFTIHNLSVWVSAKTFLHQIIMDATMIKDTPYVFRWFFFFYNQPLSLFLLLILYKIVRIVKKINWIVQIVSLISSNA